MNPYQVVKDFERALCEYTGAPYAVTTTSCTMALTLAVAWQLSWGQRTKNPIEVYAVQRPEIQIPKRTYVGVPYAIREAGGRPTFRDEAWLGMYQLRPLPVWDSARYLNGGMYEREPRDPSRPDLKGMAGQMVCLSFHWSKTLGIQQGGAILHDSPEADEWLRRARFDGRAEGVVPAADTFPLPRAWHCYMSPETAAAGLVRLASLPRNNQPLPNDDYPELDKIEVFK